MTPIIVRTMACQCLVIVAAIIMAVKVECTHKDDIIMNSSNSNKITAIMDIRAEVGNKMAAEIGAAMARARDTDRPDNRRRNSNSTLLKQARYCKI